MEGAEVAMMEMNAEATWKVMENLLKHGKYNIVTRNAMENAVRLLKKQESIKPYIDIDEAKCPNCKVKLTRQELLGDNVLFEDFFDYCPHCGKPVLWEGR